MPGREQGSVKSPDLGPFSTDTICHGDALDLLPRLPAGCIDLLVTDPPFAIGFRAQRLNYHRTGSHVLDGYREIPAHEYGEFTMRWMEEASRVLSPSGSLYVFSGWNRLKEVLNGLDQAGFTTINHLIWKYQFGVFTRRKFVTSHYHILFAVKDPRHYTFHKVEHYPEDVWVINREYWKGKKKTPTKLPRTLVQRILSFSSSPGDMILDPFLGSGTVAVVSQEMGRHFLGFEVVDEYYEFALQRLQEGRSSPALGGGELTGKKKHAEGEN
ncbi:MAG: site-specific DNA-methyltransferase [Methanolinea sp.]|nr:site-specific DNA-methyltransferase [Methanolinea sp.]